MVLAATSRLKKCQTSNILGNWILTHPKMYIRYVKHSLQLGNKAVKHHSTTLFYSAVKSLFVIINDHVLLLSFAPVSDSRAC